MWEEAVQSWPIIPFSAVGLCSLVAITGLVALLYDAGARDSGAVSQVGASVLVVALIGCLGIGLWNLTVSVARLSTTQATFATTIPDSR